MNRRKRNTGLDISMNPKSWSTHVTKVSTLDEFLGDPHKVDLNTPNAFVNVSGLTPPLIEDAL